MLSNFEWSYFLTLSFCRRIVFNFFPLKYFFFCHFLCSFVLKKHHILKLWCFSTVRWKILTNYRWWNMAKFYSICCRMVALLVEQMKTIRSSKPEADPRLLEPKQKFQYLAHKYQKLKNQLIPLLRNCVQNPQPKPWISFVSVTLFRQSLYSKSLFLHPPSFCPS